MANRFGTDAEEIMYAILNGASRDDVIAEMHKYKGIV
jgi:hypothetical protein